MKIIYKKGNLITASELVIVHGCNNRGVMGSGVARDIRRIFPEAYQLYKNYFKDCGLDMGEVIWVYEIQKWIGHCITQDGYGKDGKKYVSYDAIRRCMRNINHSGHLKVAHDNTLLNVAMPLIGAGLGGGDWNIISKIIEEESLQFQPIVYELE